MIAKGQQLSMKSPQTAAGTPLPTTLGGASVLVNGVATPLFYSSAGQIAFQARSDTYLGTALVQVIRDGQAGNTVSVNMAAVCSGDLGGDRHFVQFGRCNASGKGRVDARLLGLGAGGD